MGSSPPSPAARIRIAHIADLHFPRVNAEVVAGLKHALNKGGYHLVVISGDVTMRARIREFHLARTFIDSLDAPVLCIPGNHDISSHNLVSRFLFPFQRFNHFVESAYLSTFLDDKVAAIGINSVRRIHTNSLDWSRGRVNHRQIRHVEDWFTEHGKNRLRVVTLHHPILIDDIDHRRGLVGRHKPLVASLAKLKVNVVMTGHLHRARFERLPLPSHRLIVSQSATSCSTRLKGEDNAFNHIEYDHGKWRYQIIRWDREKSHFIPEEQPISGLD